MALTYVIKNSLYVNITNLCTNRCEFCVRDSANAPDLFKDLRLDREPTLAEIIADVSSHTLNNFSEIVFCGYGEPTCRLYDMLETCKMIRERSNTPIRVNTNGHASMILAEDTAPAFRGLVDCVSISLNAADSDTYCRLCHPRFGENTFPGVVRFAREVSKYVPKVVLTVVRGTIPDADIDRCRKIASDIGAHFRVRDLME
ncbi:MAG: radical SAM protein [Clostridia bacterium]|nr:radical SAM protein [Clostridia bacterium]